MRMTLIQDITCLKLLNNSQRLAPPEWLNDLVCSVKTFVAITVFVGQMSNPVLKLAIAQELIQFVRILTSSQFSQVLQQKIYY